MKRPYNRVVDVVDLMNLGVRNFQISSVSQLSFYNPNIIITLILQFKQDHGSRTDLMTVVDSADDLSEVLPALCLVQVPPLVDVVEQFPVHCVLHHYDNVGSRLHH